MMRICIVTSSRADYGLLKPLIQRLHDDTDVELTIIATGMHLCAEFGNTYLEIENDGYTIFKKIDIQISSDTPSAMTKTMGIAMICFSDLLSSHTPDLLIVLGDRYEIMAVCCAAVNQRIPIAHVHGGEITQGVVDEYYRHSITKMSNLHFTCCEEYRKRVIQLGENPGFVFNVGSLCIENVLNTQLLSLDILEKKLGTTLCNKPYAVVTFHPVTLENNNGTEQIMELMSAMDSHNDLKFIVTKSNSDAGGREINRLWDEYAGRRENCQIVASLGMQLYLTALKHASMIIGNSSSGIIEGPASGIPTINIGNRQKGRIMADSIINCLPTAQDIDASIYKAMTPDFVRLAKSAQNPYGNGSTSCSVVEIIKDFLSGDITVLKEFYDIKFEMH